MHTVHLTCSVTVGMVPGGRLLQQTADTYSLRSVVSTGHTPAAIHALGSGKGLMTHADHYCIEKFPPKALPELPRDPSCTPETPILVLSESALPTPLLLDSCGTYIVNDLLHLVMGIKVPSMLLWITGSFLFISF